MTANRNWIIIAIATLLGIVAVILANSYLSGVEEDQQQAAAENRLVQVAVARVPLDYGAVLNSDNIRMVSWPVNSVPEGAFQSTKQLTDLPDPRVVLRPIEAGEPILPGKITGPGGRAILSALLESNQRAITVSVSAVSGVAGFVMPGDAVDVLYTRVPKADVEGSVEQITDVLMQNVRVLAIDQVASDKASKPKLSRTMTFAVDQQDAQKLTLAAKTGELTLALRNAADQDVYMAQTVGTRDLGQGNYSASFYPARQQSPSVTANPYPAATMPASAGTRGAVARPKPKNSVSVEIVRGTTASSYDVSRYRGY